MKANVKSLRIFLTLKKIQPNTERIVLTFSIAVGGRVRILRRRWRRLKGSGEENYEYEEDENDYEENNDYQGEEDEDYEGM